MPVVGQALAEKKRDKLSNINGAEYRDSPVSAVSISAIPGLVLFPDLVRFSAQNKNFQKKFNFFKTFFKLFSNICCIINVSKNASSNPS